MKALIEDAAVELENYKYKSSNYHWRNTILEATETSEGVINLYYADPDRYENPNNNRTVAYYTLSHGVWDGQMGDSEAGSVGINWDAVQQVTGITYQVKDLLRSKGLRFDSQTKSWMR